MKTSTIIKNIHLCAQQKPVDLAKHKEVAEIFERTKNKKRTYLHEEFQEEMEGEMPSLPPPEMLAPIF